MFLNFFKKISAKRLLKKSALGVATSPSTKQIETVGVLIDTSYFVDKTLLIQALLDHGISKDKIRILLYKDRFKKKEMNSEPNFSLHDLSFKGVIENDNVAHFVAQNFDLLISYYDTEKAPLLITTFTSNADFKVGFSSIDKRLNHFMVDTNAENYTVFISELFKYLKILNKI